MQSSAFPVARTLSSFFGIGYIPIIPGTFGSLAAFAIYWPMVMIHDWKLDLAIITLITLAGVWASGITERNSGISDPSFVVIDEVAGQLITLFLHPFSWTTAITGFVLFRLLDIIKPFPARSAEKLPGGWGIMLDDVLAGIYGNMLLWIISYFTHQF